MISIKEANKEMSKLLEDITGVKGARTYDSHKLVRINGYTRDDGLRVPPIVHFGEHDDAYALEYSFTDECIYMTYGEGTRVSEQPVYGELSFATLWEYA